MPPGQIETADLMIKKRDIPIFKGLVTFVTSGFLELSTVDISVTIITFLLGVVLELSTIRMTPKTRLVLMFTFKCKSGARVIKMSLVPRCGRMTVTAWVCTEGVTVWVFIGVTGATRRIDGLVVTFGMTVSTGNLLMLTLEWKAAHTVMVKQ